VTNAFVTTVHGFHDYMSELLREGSFAKESFHAQLISSHRSVEEWWSGPLEDTNQVCWAMYTNDLTDLSSLFVAGYSAYNLYSEVLDANRKLMHRALSMFSKRAVDANYLDLERILQQVLYLVIHDAKLYLHAVLRHVLIGFLQTRFEGDVVVPSLELVRPLQRGLDVLPGPAAQLLNLPAFAESVLWKILREEVWAMVDASHADNCAEIDTTIDLVGAIAP
jgi:hypothetical protein